ncbi:MAG: aminotransferase class I/II-fold pyridoxal phosphate-dependent enzyme [Mycobacterium leprae]
MAVPRIQNGWRFDLSISVPGYGNLSRFDPESPLGKDQSALAECYGAHFAYPVTNGTTSANLIAGLTLTRPGETVLLDRSGHGSTHAMLLHNGLAPVWLMPHFSQRLGAAVGVTPEALVAALEAHPDISLAVVTYPTYWGFGTDIQGLVREAHRRGVRIMVDSAHGAHHPFHPAFPRSAIAAGADVVTVSLHKTLPAASQASAIFVRDRAVFERLYEVTQASGATSTSFSYPILLSGFQAVTIAREEGRQRFGEAILLSQRLRKALNRIPGVWSWGGKEARAEGARAFDPLRVAADVSGLGLTGYAVERLLYRHAIYAEMATRTSVLFLINLCHTQEDVDRLVQCMERIAARAPKRPLALTVPPIPAPGPMVMLPRDAFYAPRRRRVPVAEAIGRVCAETISAYPPGAPVLCTGELITAEAVDYLKSIRAYGAGLNACDPSFGTIQIVDP